MTAITKSAKPYASPSSPNKPRISPKKKAQSMQLLVRSTHKKIGLFAFFFIAWMASSGLLLNQSVSFGFDGLRVNSTPIISAYGLHPVIPKQGFTSAENWLASTPDFSILNGTTLSRKIPVPVGLVTLTSDDLEDMLVIAEQDAVTLFDPSGEVIERIESYALPTSVLNSIGTLTQAHKDLIAIRGELVYLSDDAIMWRKASDIEVRNIAWSTPSALPASSAEQISPYSQPSVSAEQLLIDLHSGRFFGSVGPWIVNTVGVSCLLLSMSGIWMTWKTNSMRKARAKAKQSK